MDFWIKVAGLIRRWRVMFPLTLASLNLGVAAFLLTPATYTSDTTQVLTMTQYGGTEEKDAASPTALTNPLLNFTDSLRTTSAIIIQAMGSKEVARELGATGTTTLAVNDGRTNPDLLGVNGPFLYIMVKSRSADQAERTVVLAQDLMRKKLLEWQQNLRAPTRTFVQFAEVVPPSAPKPNRSRGTRLGAIAIVATMALGLAGFYLSEKRRDRREAHGAAAHVEDDPSLAEEPIERRWGRVTVSAASLGKRVYEPWDETVDGNARLTMLPVPVMNKGQSRRR